MTHSARLALLLTLGLTPGCGDSGREAGGADTTVAAGPAPAAGGESSGVTFPEGFRGTVFADTLGGARHAATAPNGDLYVNTWRSPYDTTRAAPAGGYVVALRDSDGDGRADVIRRFGPTAEAGSKGGTGIAVYRGAVYVEADSSILRYRLTPGELAPGGAPDTIVAGLTTEGGHPMHPIAIDSAGNLFVNLGSDTNACQVKDRTPESPGQQPCRELGERAGIWRFRADRVGQRFTPRARYATGIRNADGLAADAAGALYATQHGRDQLAENWPKLYDWKRSARLPAEVLLRIEQGGDYGWPYCYHDPERQSLVLAPEYGGDGKQIGQCGEKRAPVAFFPAHWAPNALAFYSGTAFPEKYRGGAFIAFHGGFDRAPLPNEGFNVMFVPMGANGSPSGAAEVFADGFAGPGRPLPAAALHRPVGVTEGQDGSLYVSDDRGGRIYRIVFRGN